jgi:hypothetical protein
LPVAIFALSGSVRLLRRTAPLALRRSSRCAASHVRSCAASCFMPMLVYRDQDIV